MAQSSEPVATTESAPLTGAILTRDLMFLSKVSGTASALGYKVLAVMSPAALAEGLAEGKYRCVFVDLDLGGVPLADLAAQRGPANPNFVAFGPHVATQRLEEARAAGCDVVLPRSRFSSHLPEILNGAFGPRQVVDRSGADQRSISP
jgi:hypothetical protein